MDILHENKRKAISLIASFTKKDLVQDPNTPKAWIILPNEKNCLDSL